MSSPVSPEILDAKGRIRAHLEFLGYEIKDFDEDVQQLLAVHPQEINIMVRVFTRGVSFTVWLDLNDYAAQHRHELLECINDLNRTSAVAQFCISEDGSLTIYAVFPGVYDKVTFGQIMGLWHDDMEKLRTAKCAAKFF